jgi:plastocyanin
VKRIALLGACGAALSLVGASVPAQAKDTFQLKGEVYASGFKIEMKTAAGRTLKTVKAGTYRIKIEDHATIHNFHLKGPGVSKKTTVAGRTETIWLLRLRPGTYTFVCDPHASMMRGSFRVT